MQQPTRRRAAGTAATALTACSLFAAATLPAAAMTVTFIRHAESQGNASGYIDTSTPGPHLTNDQVNQNGGATGVEQALAFADAVCPSTPCSAFDAIYASTMIRTQETAAPLAERLDLPVTVLGAYDPARPQRNSGVQEIDAGIFEGLPEGEGIGRIGYILAPLAWTLGLQFVPIPGGETGLEFNERVLNALADVESNTTDTNGNGEQEAAVVSHGATMMMWTMMNVDNPDLMLIVEHQLDNTDTVVVEKNADGSWTLKEWAGQPVGEAGYVTKMFVNVRDLIVAPQKALYNMRLPILTLDPEAIAATGAQGLQDVAEAGVKFVKDSVTDTVEAITGIPGSLSVPAAEPADEPASATPQMVTLATSGVETAPTVEDRAPVSTISAAPSDQEASHAGSTIRSPQQKVRDAVKRLTRADQKTGQARSSKKKTTSTKNKASAHAKPKATKSSKRDAA